MKTILIDGKKMTSKADAHMYMKRKLDLPSYYGINLDALWDVLATVSKPMNIILFNKSSMDEYLGEYSNSIIKVFKEVEDSNNNIKFKIANIRHIK